MARTLDFNALMTEKLSRGDKEAFSKVFEDNYRMMFAIAKKYLKDESAAMDSVQDVFLKIWEKRSELAFGTNLRNLLYTVLKNNILNEIRNNRLHYEKLYRAAQEQQEAVFSPDQEEHNERQARILRDAIDRLPQQQRLICELKLDEQLTNTEIAERLGIALATVKVHYYKALKTLKSIKNKDLGIAFLILQNAVSVYLIK